MTQDIMYPTNSDILPEWYEQNRKRILSILSDEEEYSLVLVSKPPKWQTPKLTCISCKQLSYENNIDTTVRLFSMKL